MNLKLSHSEPAHVPILTPLSDSDFKIRLDNSSLDIIKSCPREANFYVFHRRGRGTSPAMNMGTAVHAALEYLYRNDFTPPSLTTAYNLIDQYYNLHPITDEWRGPEFAKRVIHEYARVQGPGPFTVLTKDNQPMVEVPFEIDLGTIAVNASLPFSHQHLTGQPTPTTEKTFIRNLHISIIGKIDLAVNLLGANWALDHKTASRLGDTFWSRWPLSPQMKTYSWALWKIYGELPAGAIVNVLICRRPTRTGTPIDFERQPFRYSKEVLLEWEHNTLLTVSDFIARAVVSEFPPNDSNCIRMYGKCPYYDVCALEPANRLSLLYTSQYAPVTWDPTADED